MTEQEYTLNCDSCGIPYKSKEGFPSPQICPTCRMKLDRPELEEKIFGIIDSANFKQGLTSEEATHQILALIPDIEELKNEWTFELGKVARQATNRVVEEAKREEREGILALGDKLVKGFRVDAHIFLQRVKEALKGE